MLQSLIKAILPLAILIAIGMVLDQYSINESWALKIYDQSPKEKTINYLLVAIPLIFIGFPRQIVSFFAGYLFGTWAGFIAAIFASAAGSLLAYLYGRFFESTASKIIAKKHIPLKQRLIEKTFAAVLAIRLFPIGSNLITNLAAGALRLNVGRFLAASVIGFSPQTLIFAMAGSNTDSPIATGALSAVLLVVSVIIGQRVYKQIR
jgi:uncharacterized membrane protein YdjX (TVP38/TMEM64 family)